MGGGGRVRVRGRHFKTEEEKEKMINRPRAPSSEYQVQTQLSILFPILGKIKLVGKEPYGA